jgi:hypothetical protein
MSDQKSYFKTPAEIFQDFKEMNELQDYANKQYEVIVSLKEQITNLEEENKYLQGLVGNTTIINPVSLITDEELICLEQIKKLKDQSKNRELTLDEVKKLDLLHKNLKLIREKDIVDLPVNKKKSLSNERLLAIAGKTFYTDEQD